MKYLAFAVFMVTLLISIIPANAQIYNGPNTLTVVSNDLNVTFDKVHGGVVNSLKYAGTEFLTGNGAWGTIDLVKSTYMTGDVCSLWPVDMEYQYDSAFANISYVETDSDYIITIHSERGTLVWYISKKHNLVRAEVSPYIFGGDFLYIPLIKGDTGLTFYTLDGPEYAGDTEYCVAPYYEAPLVEYINGDKNLMLFSHNPMSVAYYGYDTNSWQLHYPITSHRSILFLFWMFPQ